MLEEKNIIAFVKTIFTSIDEKKSKKDDLSTILGAMDINMFKAAAKKLESQISRKSLFPYQNLKHFLAWFSKALDQIHSQEDKCRPEILQNRIQAFLIAFEETSDFKKLMAAFIRGKKKGGQTKGASTAAKAILASVGFSKLILDGLPLFSRFLNVSSQYASLDCPQDVMIDEEYKKKSEALTLWMEQDGRRGVESKARSQLRAAMRLLSVGIKPIFAGSDLTTPAVRIRCLYRLRYMAEHHEKFLQDMQSCLFHLPSQDASSSSMKERGDQISMPSQAEQAQSAVQGGASSREEGGAKDSEIMSTPLETWIKGIEDFVASFLSGLNGGLLDDRGLFGIKTALGHLGHKMQDPVFFKLTMMQVMRYGRSDEDARVLMQQWMAQALGDWNQRAHMLYDLLPYLVPLSQKYDDFLNKMGLADMVAALVSMLEKIDQPLGEYLGRVGDGDPSIRQSVSFDGLMVLILTRADAKHGRMLFQAGLAFLERDLNLDRPQDVDPLLDPYNDFIGKVVAEEGYLEKFLLFYQTGREKQKSEGLSSAIQFMFEQWRTGEHQAFFDWIEALILSDVSVLEPSHIPPLLKKVYHTLSNEIVGHKKKWGLLKKSLALFKSLKPLLGQENINFYGLIEALREEQNGHAQELGRMAISFLDDEYHQGNAPAGASDHHGVSDQNDHIHLRAFVEGAASDGEPVLLSHYRNLLRGVLYGNDLRSFIKTFENIVEIRKQGMKELVKYIHKLWVHRAHASLLGVLEGLILVENPYASTIPNQQNVPDSIKTLPPSLQQAYLSLMNHGIQNPERLRLLQSWVILIKPLMLRQRESVSVSDVMDRLAQDPEQTRIALRMLLHETESMLLHAQKNVDNLPNHWMNRLYHQLSDAWLDASDGFSSALLKIRSLIAEPEPLKIISSLSDHMLSNPEAWRLLTEFGLHMVMATPLPRDTHPLITTLHNNIQGLVQHHPKEKQDAEVPKRIEWKRLLPYGYDLSRILSWVYHIHDHEGFIRWFRQKDKIQSLIGAFKPSQRAALYEAGQEILTLVEKSPFVSSLMNKFFSAKSMRIGDLVAAILRFMGHLFAFEWSDLWLLPSLMKRIKHLRMLSCGKRPEASDQKDLKYWKKAQNKHVHLAIGGVLLGAGLVLSLASVMGVSPTIGYGLMSGGLMFFTFAMIEAIFGRHKAYRFRKSLTFLSTLMMSVTWVMLSVVHASSMVYLASTSSMLVLFFLDQGLALVMEKAPVFVKMVKSIFNVPTLMWVGTILLCYTPMFQGIAWMQSWLPIVQQPLFATLLVWGVGLVSILTTVLSAVGQCFPDQKMRWCRPLTLAGSVLSETLTHSSIEGQASPASCQDYQSSPLFFPSPGA